MRKLVHSKTAAHLHIEAIWVIVIVMLVVGFGLSSSLEVDDPLSGMVVANDVNAYVMYGEEDTQTAQHIVDELEDPQYVFDADNELPEEYRSDDNNNNNNNNNNNHADNWLDEDFDYVEERGDLTGQNYITGFATNKISYNKDTGRKSVKVGSKTYAVRTVCVEKTCKEQQTFLLNVQGGSYKVFKAGDGKLTDAKLSTLNSGSIEPVKPETNEIFMLPTDENTPEAYFIVDTNGKLSSVTPAKGNEFKATAEKFNKKTVSGDGAGEKPVETATKGSTAPVETTKDGKTNAPQIGTAAIGYLNPDLRSDKPEIKQVQLATGSISLELHRSGSKTYLTGPDAVLLPDGTIFYDSKAGPGGAYFKYNRKTTGFAVVTKAEFDAQQKDAKSTATLQEWKKNQDLLKLNYALDTTGDFPGHYMTGPVTSDKGNEKRFALIDNNLWGEGEISYLEFNPKTGKYEKKLCEGCEVEKDKEGNYFIKTKDGEQFYFKDAAGKKIKTDPWDTAGRMLDDCSGKNINAPQCARIKQSIDSQMKVYSAKFRGEVERMFTQFVFDTSAIWKEFEYAPTNWCAADHYVRSAGGTAQGSGNDVLVFGIESGVETQSFVANDPFANIHVYKMFALEREEVTSDLYRYSFSMSLSGGFAYNVYLVNSCTGEKSNDKEGGFLYQGSLSQNSVDRQHFAGSDMLFSCEDGPCRFNYACIDFFTSPDSTKPDGRLCNEFTGGLHGDEFETYVQDDADGGSGTLAVGQCISEEVTSIPLAGSRTICDVYDLDYDGDTKLQGC